MTPESVLIVDDEPNILASLKRALEVEGYGALVASSGAEALEQAARGAPDIVLLDVVMPGMDGLATLHALKASAETAAIPVVVLSGALGVETGPLLVLGAVGVLEKPFDPTELPARLRELLAGARGGGA